MANYISYLIECIVWTTYERNWASYYDFLYVDV